MSDSTNNTQPLVGTSAAARRFDPNGAVSKAKEKLEEDWLSPLYIILSAVILTIFVVFMIYYTVGTLFNAGGTLASLGWVSTGSGLLFFLVHGIFIASCASAFGMTWKKGTLAIIFTLAAAAFIGLLSYFIFASVRDAKKDLFIVWSGLTVVAGLGAAIYGWWSTSGIAKTTPTNDEHMAAIKAHSWWSMVLLGVGVVSGLVVLLGLWNIYGTFS